ncbi:hypothetical protein Droror1_Dr00022756 [Drosera rotundifolia]
MVVDDIGDAVVEGEVMAVAVAAEVVQTGESTSRLPTHEFFLTPPSKNQQAVHFLPSSPKRNIGVAASEFSSKNSIGASSPLHEPSDSPIAATSDSIAAPSKNQQAVHFLPSSPEKNIAIAASESSSKNSIVASSPLHEPSDSPIVVASHSIVAEDDIPIQQTLAPQATHPMGSSGFKDTDKSFVCPHIEESHALSRIFLDTLCSDFPHTSRVAVIFTNVIFAIPIGSSPQTFPSGGAGGLIEQRGFDWALELLETRRDDYGLIIASFFVCFESGSRSWNIGVPRLISTGVCWVHVRVCPGVSFVQFEKSCELGNEREEPTVWD